MDRISPGGTRNEAASTSSSSFVRDTATFREVRSSARSHVAVARGWHDWTRRAWRGRGSRCCTEPRLALVPTESELSIDSVECLEEVIDHAAADATPQVGVVSSSYPDCIEDLHAMLEQRGDWMSLGAANKRDRTPMTLSRPAAARPTTPSAAGTACARATAVDSACTCHLCSKNSGWRSLNTTRGTTACAQSASSWRSGL